MYTALHAAAASGQISVVKLLLELDVEIDAVNVFGNTSLHVACLNGQDVVVKELMVYGAALNAMNHKGLVCSSGVACVIYDVFLYLNEPFQQGSDLGLKLWKAAGL